MRLKALIVTVLLAGVSQAEGPRRKASDTPTWLTTEFGIGPSFGTGFTENPAGLGLRGALGVGGGFEGFPLRFYALLGLRWTHLWSATQTGTQFADMQRDMVDISGHVRVLWAIERLRLRFDVGFGGSFLSSTVNLNGLERYTVEDDRLAVYLGAGLSYRFTRLLSAGFMLESAFPTARPERDVVATLSGLNDDGGNMGWTTLTFDVALHF